MFRSIFLLGRFCLLSAGKLITRREFVGKGVQVIASNSANRVVVSELPHVAQILTRRGFLQSLRAIFSA